MVNEDNLMADQAKFKRMSFSPNDPAISMDCPPWWRVYVDGYGGQNSLGGESNEGAVRTYLFVYCSTGLTGVRLYDLCLARAISRRAASVSDEGKS